MRRRRRSEGDCYVWLEVGEKAPKDSILSSFRLVVGRLHILVGRSRWLSKVVGCVFAAVNMCTWWMEDTQQVHNMLSPSVDKVLDSIAVDINSSTSTSLYLCITTL